MKALSIAALLAAASVGSAGIFPRDAPEVSMDVNTQCKHFSSVVQTRIYTTVEVERRCRTEEARSVSTTPEPPIVTYSHPDGIQDADSVAPPVPLLGGIPTDQVGGVVTITVTEPLTITEHGTIRITATELVLVETILRSTITHINEVGKTVTEVVRYTTTMEVTGGSTIPYQVMPTLETRYETIVNDHTENMITHIETVTTQTSGEMQHTITGGNEILTNSFGVTTYTTQATSAGGNADDSDATTPERSTRTTATLSPETTDSALSSAASVTSVSSEAGISAPETSTSVAPGQSENNTPTSSPDSISSTSETISTSEITTGEDDQNTSLTTTSISPKVSSSESINQQISTTTTTTSPSSSDNIHEVTTSSGEASHPYSPDVIHLTNITSNDHTSSSLTGTSTSEGDEITTTSSGRSDTPLDTSCPINGPPLHDEEKIMIDVIFNSGIGGTTYAQWLVNYASQLLAQVSDVAVHAMVDPNGQYTSAFDFINISGILGLASAAPMYTCFLSSLWAQALGDPQQYAKRVVPTQDEKTKLIVLFERRSDSNGDYNLAGLLLDETDNLLAEMKSVIAGQPLDLERLNGRHLLVVALNAPIATEGLNDAILSAINSNLSTKLMSTSEHSSTSGEPPSATGSGDVPTPGFPVTTFVSETSDSFTPTIPDATGGGDVPTSSLPSVTYVTEITDPLTPTIAETIDPSIPTISEATDPSTPTIAETTEESDVPTPSSPGVTYVTETTDPAAPTISEPTDPSTPTILETTEGFTTAIVETAETFTPVTTETTDPFTSTIPEAVEESDVSTSGFPDVTFVTESGTISSSSSSAVTTATD